MKTFAATLAIGLATLANAQWTSDLQQNTLAAESTLSILDVLGGSDGSTYIVYWKPVGAPANIELRLQRLDADGIPAYGSDGMLISSSINMSTSTALGSAVLDSEDNIYIGITATGNEMGHVFKLDPAGNHLWAEAGVTFSTGYGIIILPLSSGEAIVSWLNIPNALMQRYDATGAPVWTAPQAVVSGSSKTAPGELFELSNGDVELIFHAYNFGISSTLMAQRYGGATGDAIWGQPIQLSNKVTNWNTRYSIGQIGDVTYIGYKAATGLRFDSFLQRINPDGTLPWGINGSDFDVNETDYEMDTRIAVNGGEIWSLCNYKDITQSENGERIQKFDAETGDRLFTDFAKEVFPIGSDIVHASDLWLRDGAPFFLIENGWDNGFSVTELDLVALDEDGEFLWPESMQPMATFEASKSQTHLTRLIANQTVAVWMEDKSTGPAAYAQPYEFQGTGNVVLEREGQPEMTTYPNPTDIQVNCSFQSFQSGQVELRAYNATGQIVECLHANVNPGENVLPIDVSNWPAGMYHLVGQWSGPFHEFKSLGPSTFMIAH